ncbi:MAG: thioesterase family protein [Candidatus Omnitrophota bacterium]|nr:thioesterase family protein [Candidatus Omnitrophota bacterium]
MEDFFIENKIYYHDTDCGGVVYYAKYLEHLEEGRAQLCLSRGINLSEYAKNKVAFAVVHEEADYKSPARCSDTIRIFTQVERIGNSSISFVQEIKRGDTLLVKAKTVWACVGADFKTQTIPDEIRKRLS